MSRPTLITGAAGFAGGHLLDALRTSADTHPLVGWHRPGTSLAPLTGVTWQGVDLLDRAAVRAAVAHLKPSRVYHCAGAAHVGDAWNATARTLSTNVLGTHHLVEALRTYAPDARVVITSSALVYASSDAPMNEDAPRVPKTPYGLSKLAQETTAEGSDTGPAICIARAFNHIGPRQSSSFSSASFARQIAAIEAQRQPAEIVVGNLDPRRDITDVRDTVRAYVRIMERGERRRAYNVCSGRALTIGDLLDALLERARVPIVVRVDPARYRPSDQPVVVGDPSRIRDELGWTPTIPFDRTLDDILEYWRAQTSAS
ncbi:MAG: GDP-mannose 4,6-dehydratase [Acidobacteriaceae bacterium]|jgi:GDP-4-dehydro-6-deoxy-D-mannose reductase|nr:GDP-mannose 4,6-dehydratase [Acidobacteriaceae bacterium]